MNETRPDPNRPIVTYGLTLLNVLIFGIMILCGIHASNPNPDDLIKWVTVGTLVVTIGVCAALPRSIVTWERTVNAFVQAEQDIRAAFKQIVTQAVK